MSTSSATKPLLVSLPTSSPALFAAVQRPAPGPSRMVPVPEASTEWLPDENAAVGGLPADRGARLAARRAFVILKLNYLYVVEGLDNAEDLKLRVRLSETPEDLWALRSALFLALSGDEPAEQTRRRLLNNSVDAMFPPPQSWADLQGPVQAPAVG